MLSQNKENILYAGFFVRLSAYIIDCIIVGLALLVIKVPYLVTSIINSEIFIAKPILFKFSIVDIIVYLLSLVYFVLMTYYCGATLGKKVLNIRVCKESGDKLSLIDVLYRESIGRYLSGLIVFIGYIIIAVDSRKRGLHDILCDTVVVYDLKKKNINNNNIIVNSQNFNENLVKETPIDKLSDSENYLQKDETNQ